MYDFNATLGRVVDGDTVHLDLDLGFFEWRRDQSYRLLRVNAPEMSTSEGVAAKDWLATYLMGKKLTAHTEKSDHFGRYLVELTADGVSVSDALVTAGHAVYKTY